MPGGSKLNCACGGKTPQLGTLIREGLYPLQTMLPLRLDRDIIFV